MTAGAAPGLFIHTPYPTPHLIFLANFPAIWRSFFCRSAAELRNKQAETARNQHNKREKAAAIVLKRCENSSKSNEPKPMSAAIVRRRNRTKRRSKHS